MTSMEHRQPTRVVIINDASTAFGGATGLALLSAELLAERGIPVTFIAGDGGQGERLQALDVEIVAVGGVGLMKDKRAKAAVRGIYNRTTTEVIGKWISERDEPGVVYHVHGWSKVLSPSVLDALRPVASRTLLHAHDFFLVCPNGGFMDYPKGQPCSRKPLSFDCVSANCDKRSYAQKLWRVGRQHVLRSRLGRAGWAGIVMIHPLMAPYFRSTVSPEITLSAIPNPSEALSQARVRIEKNNRFFFIGRVEAEKGIEDAIQAARLADVPLVVMGEGPLRSKLEKKHPSVEFTGWMSREEMREAVQSARALIMPTRYPEPYGLVAAEAARSGIPVILATSAFLGHEFEKYGLGLRCDTRDHVALANAISRVRDMAPDEIQDLSGHCKAEADRIFNTPQQWITELLKLYRGTLTPHV